MARVLVMLADGFEEIEGLTVIDVLRRGKVDVSMVSVTGSLTINGSHGIVVQADELFEKADFGKAEMIVLPGGLKGTNMLMEHEGLKKKLAEYNEADKWLAAICAAPSVLGMNGILDGKKAICYPGFEDKLLGAEIMTGAKVVQYRKVVTSRGMGTALDFALKLLELLTDAANSEKVAKAIQYDPCN